MPTLNLQINDGNDDGYEASSGTVSLNTGATLISDAVNEWAGFRFASVAIPQGATILTAVAQFVPSNAFSDEPDHTFYADDSDNAAAFSTSSNDMSGRSRTTASVLWSSADLGADGTTYFPTPDLSTIIQEVVDRAGWASGNAIALLYVGSSNGNRDLGVQCYDGFPSSAAKLDITFSVPRAARSVYHHLVGGMR